MLRLKNSFSLQLVGFSRNYMHSGEHFFLAGVLFKLHHAVTGGEDGKVAAKAHADAWVHFGANLTNDDVASNYRLTAEALNAAPLALTVATVT